MGCTLAFLRVGSSLCKQVLFIVLIYSKSKYVPTRCLKTTSIYPRSFTLYWKTLNLCVGSPKKGVVVASGSRCSGFASIYLDSRSTTAHEFMSISRQPERMSDDLNFYSKYGPPPKFKGFSGWSSEDGQPIDQFLKIPKVSGGWRRERIVVDDDGDDVGSEDEERCDDEEEEEGGDDEEKDVRKQDVNSIPEQFRVRTPGEILQSSYLQPKSIAGCHCEESRDNWVSFVCSRNESYRRRVQAKITRGRR